MRRWVLAVVLACLLSVLLAYAFTTLGSAAVVYTGIPPVGTRGVVTNPSVTTGGGGGAATTNHYVTTQAEVDLTAEFNLGALSTGLLKLSVAGGVGTPQIATPGTDYVLPGGTVATATQLAADGTNCGAGQAAQGVDASGNAQGCFTPAGGGTPGGATTQVQFNDGGVFGGDAGLTYNKTTDVLTAVGGFSGPLLGNATTATALAANGTNCPAGQAPLGVDASGNAEGCFTPPGGVAPSRLLTTTAPLTGGGDLSADRTFTCPTCTTNAAALTSGQPVIGQGAQAAAVGTKSGNTTAFVTKDASTPGANECAKWDAAGNLTTAGAACGTSTGAPSDAHYLTTQTEPGLSAEANLGALTNGLLKLTISGGVATPSTATPGTDYVLPGGSITGNASTATALAANGTNCPVGQAPVGIDAQGNVEGCFTPTGSGTGLPDPGTNGLVIRNSATPTTVSRAIIGTTNQVSVTNGDGVAGNPILAIPTNPVLPGTTSGTFSGPLTGTVTGNASTATALAANGTNCGAGQAAAGVDASGNAEGCFTPAGAGGDITDVGTCTTGACFTDTTPGARLTYSLSAAPGTPSPGAATLYVSASPNKNIALKDDAGVVKHGVQTKVPVTGQFVTGIADDGSVSQAIPTKTDVGLSQVDNTSDATKWAATADVSNKLIVPRTSTCNPVGAAPPTITPNMDNTDICEAFGLTANTTIADPVYTAPRPYNNQRLEFIFKGASPVQLTWGPAYSGECGLPLPVGITGDGTGPTGTRNHYLFGYNTSGGSNKLCLLATTRSPGRGVTELSVATTNPTLTCNADANDECNYALTGAAGTATLGVPGGTPTNGQMLIIGLRCTVAVQTIAYNAMFIPSRDVVLPTSCPVAASPWIKLGFEYSTALTKWQLVGSTEATSTGGGGGALTIQEIDGSPTGSFALLKVSNGSLTNNGDGSATLTTGAGGGGGDVTSNTALSVDGEVALFSGPGGKTIKRATGTGMAKLTGTGSGGVLATATAGADYVAPTTTIATTAPLAGGGDLSANRTLTIGDAAANGTTKGVATFTATDFTATTGVVSLNYVAGQKATASVPGFLSQTDWSTFNGKQAALGFTAVPNTLTISTTAPLAGGGDLSVNRTLSIGNAAADGTTKGAATFTGTDFTATAGVVSLNYVAGQKATASVPGFLSQTDWSTFNGKQGALTNSAGLAAALNDETGSAGGGLAVFSQSPTIVTPTIASFANATHTHTTTAGGGQLTDAALSSPVTRAKGGLNSATPGTGLLRDGTTPTASELSGDVTTSGSNAATVARVNGVTYPASPAVDTVPVVTAAGVATYKAIPDCDDTAGQHLNYDTTAHLFSCGTTGSGGGTACTPAGASGQAQYNNASVSGGSSGLTLNSSQILTRNDRLTAMAADLTISTADGPIIACTAGATTKTATLPTVATTSQGFFRVVKVDTGAGGCSVVRSGTDTINNAATALTVLNRDEYIELWPSSGSNWTATVKTAAAGVSFASATETTTGTEAAKAVTPDGLAGSDFGKRYISMMCVEDATDLTAGTGKCYVPLHPDFNGWNVVGSSAHVGDAVAATSGINVDIQRCGAVATGKRCTGTNVSVFSTVMTIDINEDGTETGIAGTINPTNQALSTGQWLRVDVSGTFTAAKGLYVTVVVQKP